MDLYRNIFDHGSLQKDFLSWMPTEGFFKTSVRTARPRERERETDREKERAEGAGEALLNLVVVCGPFLVPHYIKQVHGTKARPRS